MRKPNLFICGFAKGGTTVLYNYFCNHPDVYCNPFIKEPRFFSKSYFDKLDTYRYFKKNAIGDVKEYLKLFRNVGSEKYIADGSVYYSFFRGIAGEIKAFNSDSKVVLCIRNPIERFNSHYMMHLRSGFGKCTLDEFIVNPYSSEGINLLEVGLYHDSIQEYFDVLGRDNVYVAFFDDLANDHAGFYKDICSFLNIPYKEIDNKRINMSGKPKSQVMMHIIRFIKWMVPKSLFIRTKFRFRMKVNKLFYGKHTMDRIPVPDDARARLIEYYSDDIVKTGELVGRDLSHWIG